MKVKVMSAILLGIGIWFLVQHSDQEKSLSEIEQRETDTATANQTATNTPAIATTTAQNKAITNENIGSSTVAVTPEEVHSAEPIETTPRESIKIAENSLSTEQKKVLDTFGVDTGSLEISPAMVACAEEKVGEARIQELLNGANPSFVEGISLASCYKPISN